MKIFYPLYFALGASILSPLALHAKVRIKTTQSVVQYPFTSSNIVSEDSSSSFNPAAQWKAANTPHVDCAGYPQEKQIYRALNTTWDNQGVLSLNFNPKDIKAVYVCPNITSTFTQSSGAVYTTQPITKRKDGTLILHGKVTVIAKVPSISPGTWPAIWMLPQNTPFSIFQNDRFPSIDPWPTEGEIDILEMAGRGDFGAPNNTFFSTLHYGPDWQNDKPRGYTSLTTRSLSDGFHTYELEWNITPSSPVQKATLKSVNAQKITLTVHLDNDSDIHIARKIWDSYSPVTGCGDDNAIKDGKISEIQSTCPQAPIQFTLNKGDEILTRIADGFNSGFRLIINYASGGGMFTNDGTDSANTGATVAGNFQVKSVTVTDLD